MLVTALLVAAVVQTPSYDGLNISLPAEAKRQTQGQTKAYHGDEKVEHEGVFRIVRTFSLSITDLSKMDSLPTTDQIMTAFERGVRTRKPMAAFNLRRTKAKIGGQDLLVLTGSAIAPDWNNKPMAAGIVSFAFVADKKLFEYAVVSMTRGPALVFDLDRVINMTYGADKQKVTGVARNLEGDYTVGGVPFTFTMKTTPFAAVFATDPTYATGYTAAASDLGEYEHYILVRQLKPDDKRPNDEIFMMLAGAYSVQGAGAAPFKVSGDSATVSLKGIGPMTGEVDSNARFERVGNWVAITVTNVPLGKTANHAAFGLKATR
jgi:hypothetical protein